MTMMILRGPGGGSVALYCSIMPHTRDASELAHIADRGFEMRAADIVEIDVDAVRERALPPPR